MPMKPDQATLDEMQEDLQIIAGTPEQLDTELIQQAQSYGHVGTLFAMAVALRDRRKHDLAILEAKLDRDVRDELINNDEKVTEAKVERAIREEASHQRAMSQYLDACQLADSWEALKDAYKQRSYMLREIVNLRVHDYLSEVTGSGERRGARDRSYDRRFGT